MTKFEIVIVGGGPNGLNASLELSKIYGRDKVLLIEKGSLFNNLKKFPDVLWHSTMNELVLASALNDHIDLRYNPISSELVKYYNYVANEHDVNHKTNCNVTNIEKILDDTFKITYTEDQVEKLVSAKYVILATGVYENTRMLGVNEKFDFVTNDIEVDLIGKNVVVVGGGNSAIDAIIHLLPRNKVFWILKGDNWRSVNSNLVWIFKETIEKYNGNLTIFRNSGVNEIYVDQKVSLITGEVLENIDRMCVLIGFTSKNDLFEKIGLSYEKDCLRLNENFETSISGIYAFGSIMARWNNERKCPDPTYIHNGNPPQLKKIIESILKKDLGNIMDSSKILKIEPTIRKPIHIRAINKLKRILSLN